MYVDDCILLAKEYSSIVSFIESLSRKDIHENSNFGFTKDGLFKIYLCTEFNKRDDGTMKIKQKFSIKEMVAVLEFDNDHINFK